MEAKATAAPNLIDERTAADALGLMPRTLQEWRRRGYGPPVVRVSSRCIRYDVQDLRRWLDSRKERT